MDVTAIMEKTVKNTGGVAALQKMQKNYKNRIFMEKYVIDDYQYRALLAMREFAENAFCGYQEGHGQKEEQELANSFSWLVINFIDLIDATKETVDEYIESEKQYKQNVKPLN